MTLFAGITRVWKYNKTCWTPIGRDCISLDVSLCRWLAERLNFLAEHHHSYPVNRSPESWVRALRRHASVLAAYANQFDVPISERGELVTDAQKSLRWIAKNLPSLWD